MFQKAMLSRRARGTLSCTAIRLFISGRVICKKVASTGKRFRLLRVRPKACQIVMSCLKCSSARGRIGIVKSVSTVFCLGPSIVTLGRMIIATSRSGHTADTSVISHATVGRLRPDDFDSLVRLMPKKGSTSPRVKRTGLVQVHRANGARSVSSLKIKFCVSNVSRGASTGLRCVPGDASTIGTADAVSGKVSVHAVSASGVRGIRVVHNVPSITCNGITGNTMVVRHGVGRDPLSTHFGTSGADGLFSMNGKVQLSKGKHCILGTSLGCLRSGVSPHGDIGGCAHLATSTHLSNG